MMSLLPLQKKNRVIDLINAALDRITNVEKGMRRERIATAVIAGMMASGDNQRIADFVRTALEVTDALIDALDSKETP